MTLHWRSLFLGAVLGALVAFLVTTSTAASTFDPHDPAQCSAYDGSLVYNNISVCRHFAVSTIPLKMDASLDSAYAAMARAQLEAWSTVGVVEVVYAGAAAAADCDPANKQPERDVLHFCRSDGSRWGYEFITDHSQPYPYRHFYAARLWLDVRPAPYNNAGVACHEGGHALGMNHGAGEGSASCMDWTGDGPGETARRNLALLYAHLTGATVTPTATQIATASPTPTLNPTPSPTTVPAPPCWPPRAKRCR